MRVQTRPSHVALLVKSVESSANFLRQFGFQTGPAETWEGEGTKEIYVESGRCNSLLLMQPAKPGAYQRAMAKRGPGLHHLAIDVLNLEEFLISIAGSGWFLHPTSVKTITQSKTAYLARPGFPALIEVQQKEKLATDAPFVSKIELPLDGKMASLISTIGLEDIVTPNSSEPMLTLGEKRVSLSMVLHPTKRQP